MSAALPLEALWLGLLATLRVTALLLAAPIFGHRSVPVRVRVGIAVLCVIALAPFGARAAAAIGPNAPAAALVAALVGEVLLGLALGFAARLVFAGFALLGEFVAVQGGLGAATVLDPASGASTVVLTSLLQLVALTLFLAVDGHHLLLRGVHASFAALPPGAVVLPAVRFEAVVGLGSVIWELAARLALPVTAVMLTSNLAVGILGRVIPQLNLIALQLPAHIALTFAVLALGAGLFTGVAADVITSGTEAALTALLPE